METTTTKKLPRWIQEIPLARTEALASTRILDFDIENRPLSYSGKDFTTADVTAIAAGFCDEQKVHCWLLGRDSQRDMLLNFVELYNKADVVTGHYIRGHDLRLINGALVEHGLEPLGSKVTQDTYLDLPKLSGISKSQENLCAMFGVPAPKVHMNQHSWRVANRLTPEGIELTRQRVVGDVLQHQQLRQVLLERKLLSFPRVWRP